MRALVTGMGRSGTLWVATALRECCGETMAACGYERDEP